MVKAKPSVGAMKIARNLPVSERCVEWYKPTPAPSLRELSAKLTEGVSPDEWERINIQSFVGAMKIARQPRGFASTRLNGKNAPHTEPPKIPRPLTKHPAGG